MSTHIATITGAKEDFTSITESVWSPTTMVLTRFWGGEQGRCLQLTVNNGEGYIQFTEEEAKEVARILLNSFDNTIYPSE